MTNIRDVAKRANVSISTVSRVLNHQEIVTPEKREQVLQAIEELGFQPNGLARGLIHGRTQTIGVIVPDISSLTFAEIVHGMEEMAHMLGWNLIICSSNGDLNRISSYLQMFGEKRVDGIAYTKIPVNDEQYEILTRLSIPVVLVATRSEYPLYTVFVDREQASCDAVQYLIQKGHRKIGLLSGPINDTISSLPKLNGYRKALQISGLAYNPDYVYCGENYLIDNGKTGIEVILEKTPDLTAVFATSDEMAFGIYSYCFEKGIRIPQELSVIGYDGVRLSSMFTPPLTTISQPHYEIGEQAISKLVDLIHARVIERIHPIDYQILERESVLDLTRI
ncbi:MAG: LacI family transcriptional regulator [Bacilli bacterium]|nr:LacI family transcriptional regulator [Bacilli bacterium]